MTDRLYGRIADGAVAEGPRTLPTSWRTVDAEILAFDRLADPTPYGWWPWIDEPAPAFDPATHRLEPAIALDEPGRRIVCSFGVVALTPEEIAAQAPQVVTYKSDIARRCTEGEAAMLRGLLEQTSAQFWLLYMGVQSVNHGAAEFPILRQAFTELLGQDRADLILAPSEVVA